MARAKIRPRKKQPTKKIISTDKALTAIDRLGVKIIPLHGIRPNGSCTCGEAGCSSPGKHPNPKYAPKGVNSPKLLLGKLLRILKKEPYTNLAVATGGEARLIVLDVDKRSGGLESLDALQEEHGELPLTVSLRTGGGGLHYWFRLPEKYDIDNLRGELAKGIEIKANGGMANIPPSQHASGRPYEWDRGCRPQDIEIEELPQWACQIITKPKPADNPHDQDQPAAFSEGARNQTLTSIAGTLRRLGCRGKLLRKALAAINKVCLRPPLPGKEVDGIAKSVSRYEADATPMADRQEPFPLEVLPQKLRDFLRNASKAMGCSVDMIAVPMLAVAAGAIGTTRRMQVKEGWYEPAVIWAFVVAESGTLKSPALELAVLPAEDQQRILMEKYKQEKHATRNDQSGDSETPLSRVMISDTTIEAVIAILAQNPRGLFLYCDEASGWVGSFDQYKKSNNADESKWLLIHGARLLMTDRKTGEQPTIMVPRAAISVSGGIQPGVLNRVITQERRESGFAARIIFTIPPRRAKRWTNESISDKATQSYSEHIRRLYTLQPNDDGEPIDLPMTPEAQALFIQFYNDHNEEGQGHRGDMAAAWSKLEGYAARLALIVELLDWAFSGPIKPPPNKVSARSVKAGIRLARWFGAETKRLLGHAEITNGVSRLQEVQKYIAEKWGKDAFTARDLARANSRYEEDAQDLLDQLESCGSGEWVKPKRSKKGGRPTRKFRLILDGTEAGDE
ncbi:MAG: DUF3987 domain-containing protein [Verrucomicrobiota bacterium]